MASGGLYDTEMRKQGQGCTSDAGQASLADRQVEDIPAVALTTAQQLSQALHGEACQQVPSRLTVHTCKVQQAAQCCQPDLLLCLLSLHL